jgi:hypothetical protein
VRTSHKSLQFNEFHARNREKVCLSVPWTSSDMILEIVGNKELPGHNWRVQNARLFTCKNRRASYPNVPLERGSGCQAYFVINLLDRHRRGKVHGMVIRGALVLVNKFL